MSGASRARALAFLRAVLPPGKKFPGGNEATLDRIEEFLKELGGGVGTSWRVGLRLLEIALFLRHGKSLRKLPPEAIEAKLEAWTRSGLLRRLMARGLASPAKVRHFDDPKVYAAIGCVYPAAAAQAEEFRWRKQIEPGASVPAGETLECDVVVAGTGAGGAVVAKELAERGFAVLLLEEGQYYTRKDVDGRALEALNRFYRDRGMTGALGNGFIPIPMGRLVGGSTAVNTGTCWRTPGWILDHWVKDLGLKDLSAEALAPYFERVEKTLQVEPATPKVTGGVGRVIARGCDALGWHHLPLRRNAPECDGHGVCDFGCPIDARRSTNISYVPPALQSGARLLTGARADRVVVEQGRAAGLEVVAGPGGARFRVRARATVLSCGSVMTPTLLLRQGIANRSGRVGRNLSLHPAVQVSALFDEAIEGYKAAPQGYCVDQFHREGILLLGASAPLDIGAEVFPFVGRKLMEVMEAYDRVASFGVMVEDESRGRVRVGPGGRPFITYWLGKGDVERLRLGVQRTCEIYFAAGARAVYPGIHGVPHEILQGDAGGMEALKAVRPNARDFTLVSSFHPLGTCRMGVDPGASVVGPSHETHDVPALYIADGSVVPTPPAVNPQVTIMTLATRASDQIARALG